MARITIEDCTDQVSNHFILVLMTAVRTKQLKHGSNPRVSPGENRAVVTALREIAEGLVQADQNKPAAEDAAG